MHNSRKIIQILPFAFEHIGWVEKYAEILNEIFPNEITTIEGWKDFEIFEPVQNCSVPKFWQRNFWKIWKKISRKNTKIIISHIRFSPTTWFVFLIAKAKKIPYLHIEHGTGFLIHRNFWIRNIAKIFDLTIGKIILRRADWVVCVSEAGKNWVQNFSNRAEKISVIYRGFSVLQTEKIQNPISKIGFVGRLVSLKNLTILFQALKNLEKYPWTLEIVGEWEMQWEWENFVKNLWIHHRVKFLGNKNHEWLLQNFYPKIDIFVNPSLQEWLPTTVIEAMLSGVTVLASDVGGTREIPNISLFEPNETSLTENLKKNFDWKNLPKTKNSHNFSLQKMKHDFEQIFKNL